MIGFSWTSRAAPIVQIGIGTSAVDNAADARWDVATWSGVGALWSGDEPHWVDITAECHRFEPVLGRKRATDRFDPARLAVIVSNESGWADPVPLTDPDTLTIRAGRPIRAGIVHEVYGTIWLYRGYVDSVTPRYDPVHAHVVTLTAVCALGEAGRATVPKVAAEVGAGELGHQRIARIANAAKWSTKLRVFEATSVAMLGTTLGRQAADLFGVTVDSLGGALYGDTAGRLVLRNRDWQLFDPSTDPIAGTIGQGALDVWASAWTFSNARRDIVTRVVLARDTDATPQPPYDDPTGQALYGVEDWTSLDLVCSTTVQLDRLADRVLRTRGWETAERVESVRIDASTSDRALDLVTLLDVFGPSRYACSLVTENGAVFEREMFATGVRHVITPDGWTVDINLDFAESWAISGGRWGFGYWDQSTWNETV